MKETMVDTVDHPEVDIAQTTNSEVNEKRKNNTKKINLNDLLRRLNETKKVERKNNLLIIFATVIIISVSTLSVLYLA